jgi:hypothetical protein
MAVVSDIEADEPELTIPPFRFVKRILCEAKNIAQQSHELAPPYFWLYRAIRSLAVSANRQLIEKQFSEKSISPKH